MRNSIGWVDLNYKLFPPQLPALLSASVRWRKAAGVLGVSKEAKTRLDWILYYQEHGGNVALTCRRFGIARKTFYRWWREFDPDNVYSLNRLQDHSRAPHHVRQRKLTRQQEERIVALRRRYPRYGKIKLAVLYLQAYEEPISSWKVQKVIEKHQLYYHPQKNAKIRNKQLQARAHKKKRLTELQDLHWYQKHAGYIICLDGLTIYWNSFKRYIFTAIDKYGKVTFARMYKTKSSQSTRDFLHRLYFLLDGKVPRVGHDNGSEFAHLFRHACQELKIEQYYSRVRTPKDNADNERFNRTLREEFLEMGNFHSDPSVCNRKLTEWLIEYNFRRPHAALNYQTPMQYSKVLPMYSSSTGGTRRGRGGLAFSFGLGQWHEADIGGRKTHGGVLLVPRGHVGELEYTKSTPPSFNPLSTTFDHTPQAGQRRGCLLNLVSALAIYFRHRQQVAPAVHDDTDPCLPGRPDDRWPIWSDHLMRRFNAQMTINRGG